MEAVFKEQGEDLCITSTYEGNHGGGSLHYANQAFDLHLVQEAQEQMARILRARLGTAFDVVLEGDHFHVEYDPK